MEQEPIVAKLTIAENGQVSGQTENGQPLTRKQMRRIWVEKGNELKQWLSDHATEINGDMVALVRIKNSGHKRAMRI